MTSKLEQLKKLNADKKELSEKQKALRVDLEATKKQRKVMREIKASSRKEIITKKSELATLTTSIFNVFKTEDTEEIKTLADSIVKVVSELAASVHNFGEACGDPEDFQVEEI